MKKINFFIIALVFFSLISCTSESDKLEGNWSGSSSRVDSFVRDRTFQTDNTRKSYLNNLSFLKETKNSGSFTSNVTPVMTLQEKEPGNPIFIGSKISGTWEIKDKKLYMNFGGSENIQLEGSNYLSQQEQEYVKSQIFQNWCNYVIPAENGMEFTITKDGKNYKLRIFFGDQIVEFYKKAK